MTSFGSMGEYAVSEGPPESSPPQVAHLNATGVSDVPTVDDEIGFKPYVRAIGWFLSNETTKPPLTMSIEGPWGSGKSSFMLQLEQELKEQNKKQNHFYVKFNAWRSDKDEALWAGFAIAFIEQLAAKISWRDRTAAHLKLLWKRFEWSKSWTSIIRVLLFLTGLTVISICAWNIPSIMDQVGPSGITLPWLAALYYGLEKSRKIFGNPLSYDLSQYVRDLKYEDKIAFIERFHKDFTDVVQSYVGEGGRVYVFIDDLDRCEVPRAAELLQAINLLLSSDHGALFFILGLDREMVAAGIAAKNEKILPYLSAGRKSKADPSELAKTGIAYGYSYMEKFIQVPFRIPRPDEREINIWTASLVDTTTENFGKSKPARQRVFDLQKGYDPEEFEQVVEAVAPLIAYNPRRLKQFINVFRLRLMIAFCTGVLAPATSGGGASASGTINIQKIGLLTAILMRWSQLANDLADQPTLLDELIENNENATGLAGKWAGDQDLLAALNGDLQSSLYKIDLRPFLTVMPDAYSGMMSEGAATTERTRLASALRSGSSVFTESAFSGSNANTNSSSERAPTGPTGSSGPPPTA